MCSRGRENETAKIPPFHEGKLSSKQKAITSLWGRHKNENNKHSNRACVCVFVLVLLCLCARDHVLLACALTVCLCAQASGVYVCMVTIKAII